MFVLCSEFKVKTINTMIFFIVNSENGSSRPKQYTRVKGQGGARVYDHELVDMINSAQLDTTNCR